MAAPKQAVRISDSRAVLIEGRLRGAGEVVDVGADDAATLLAEGYAEDAKARKPNRRPTTGRREDRAERKPLTIEAVEDGEGERA